MSIGDLMSLYKTKHLTHIKNKRRKSIKIEVATITERASFSSMVWFMDTLNKPYWERVPQSKHQYFLTGKFKICLKSKGRGRPHLFQKYVAPQVERTVECLYFT